MLNFAKSAASSRAIDGGDEETRTPDPLLARQVLSQLSYTPKMRSGRRMLEAGKNRIGTADLFSHL
jgi:hypothetical protein